MSSNYHIRAPLKLGFVSFFWSFFSFFFVTEGDTSWMSCISARIACPWKQQFHPQTERHQTYQKLPIETAKKFPKPSWTLVIRWFEQVKYLHKINMTFVIVIVVMILYVHFRYCQNSHYIRFVFIFFIISYSSSLQKSRLIVGISTIVIISYISFTNIVTSSMTWFSVCLKSTL